MPKRYLSRADVKAIKALQRKGKSQREIVRLTGWSKGAVSRAVDPYVKILPHVQPEPAPEPEPIAPEPVKPVNDDSYVAKVLTVSPSGFPVAFSRPHFRVRAA